MVEYAQRKLRTLLVLVACMGAILAPKAESQAAADATGAAVLRPWLHLDGNDRTRLAQRAVVVRSLPAADRQIGIVAACAASISPEALLSRLRGTGDLRRAAVSGRFNDPPLLADLSALTLDQGDIDRLRMCRPGDCRLNLAEQEIASMREALRDSGSGPSPAAQESFRQIVLDRVNRYRSGGLHALPAYDDRAQPVRPAAIFLDILRQIPHLKAQTPSAAAYLERFPSGDNDALDSSLNWTKVTMNDKPVVMATHVAVFRAAAADGVPTVLVARKQVYASRYMNGDLMLTMLFTGAGESANYLVVVNRSQLDELTGMFSGMKRAAIEGRVKDEAAKALAALRDDLERSTHSPRGGMR
jgi:hypothetical protein